MTWPDGTVYIGNFKKDKIQCTGLISKGNMTPTQLGYAFFGESSSRYINDTVSQAICIGEFKGGKINCQEKFKFQDGAVYEGELKNGRRNGQGRQSYADGAVYVGEFKNGQRNGQGVITYADGAVYVGLFQADKPSSPSRYSCNHVQMAL